MTWRKTTQCKHEAHDYKNGTIFIRQRPKTQLPWTTQILTRGQSIAYNVNKSLRRQNIQQQEQIN